MAKDDDKLMAAFSYSLIIAPIVLIKEKKNQFARFHAKQALGVLLLFLIVRALIGLTFIFWLPLFANAIVAIILAYYAVEAMMGQKTKIPIAYDLGNWITGLFGK